MRHINEFMNEEYLTQEAKGNKNNLQFLSYEVVADGKSSGKVRRSAR
jgi:hypothetical protein